jgi:heat shock protein beta
LKRAQSLCLTHELNFRDVFLRELLSNANDALEKLRLTALTEKSVWDGVSPLNVTIKAEKNPDGEGGRIVITGLY